MLLLAIDTSGSDGSLALAQGDAHSFQLLGTAVTAGGMFSAQLVPQIAALLTRHHLNQHQLDGFAAATGPGTFTGLRVGLAAIKALAEVLNKPISAVSVLEACFAMASFNLTAPRPELLPHALTLLDARRDEVFAGEFALHPYPPRMLREFLLTRQELAALLQEQQLPACTPDAGLYEFLLRQNLPVAQIQRPGSDAVARLGILKMLAGDVVTPETLDANYIRRSDAEIAAPAKKVP